MFRSHQPPQSSPQVLKELCADWRTVCALRLSRPNDLHASPIQLRSAWKITNNVTYSQGVEAYRRATKREIDKFLRRETSFPECIHALDAALAASITNLKPEELPELRALMLTNNEIVMEEMLRRENARKARSRSKLKAKPKKAIPRKHR